MVRTSQQRVDRRRVAAGLALTLAATVMFVSPASAADSTGTPQQVTVKPAKPFTETTIVVNSGDTVTVRSSGRMHFGGGKIAGLTPAGIPWGTECDSIASNLVKNSPWPAPETACWSLIAKVGEDGKPVGVGLTGSFKSDRAGPLFLGINDNFVDDNSGSWQANVTVTPRGSSTTTPAATGSDDDSKSNSSLFLIGGAILALLLLLFLFLMNRRRRKPEEEVEPAFVAPAIPNAPNPYAAVAAAAVATPKVGAPEPEAALEPEPVPVAAAPWSAPPDAESIDVNIFDVEFNNGLTLRVGYNHFPEGTDLRWKVTQNRIPVATGHFVTKGGGSTNHLETVPLGVKLDGRDAQPDGADVQFDWAINGVPFRYSVRRDPNC